MSPESVRVAVYVVALVVFSAALVFGVLVNVRRNQPKRAALLALADLCITGHGIRQLAMRYSVRDDSSLLSGVILLIGSTFLLLYVLRLYSETLRSAVDVSSLDRRLYGARMEIAKLRMEIDTLRAEIDSIRRTEA